MASAGQSGSQELRRQSAVESVLYWSAGSLLFALVTVLAVRAWAPMGVLVASPQLVYSATKNTYYDLNDTTFTDLNLNTELNPYTYQVYFYAQADTIGSSDPGSSVYLSIGASDQKLNLSWDFNTPWANDTFHVFKRDNGTVLFNYLATTNAKTLTDTAFTNDTTYCYYIKSFGHYTNPLIQRPLINLSEIQCAAPKEYHCALSSVVRGFQSMCELKF